MNAEKGECYENASREPEKSPFSDISGMTDVSDPPSELIDPSDIRAITVSKQDMRGSTC
jgi:hypothetical protein